MTLPDDPRLLRKTRHFAATVLAGEVPADLQPDISNLVGFAKNFYLQFFQTTFGLEISGFNVVGKARVRRLELAQRAKSADSTLLLISHYLTLASVLDEGGGTSDEMDEDQEYAEVLAGIAELLARIRVWAEDRGLARLAKEADETYEEFDRATAILANDG